MPQMDTYDQVGKREDVSDVISNIDPYNTPFQSSVGGKTVKNTLYQWQEDHLEPAGVNAQVEGADPDDITLTPTEMRSNTTQILVKSFKVSRSANKMSTYGRAKELAYQAVRAMRAIKTDLEYSLVGTAQTMVAGSDTVARQFAGVQAQIDPSMVVTAGTPAEGSTAAVAGPLNEDLILSANELLYNSGGEATVLSVKPSDARKVADMAYTTPSGIDTGRLRDTGQGTSLTNVVDVYRSPYGTQKVTLNRWQRAQDAFLFDPKMWKLAVYDNWQRVPLAKTGDSERQMIVGEFGLQHANYKASALITNLA